MHSFIPGLDKKSYNPLSLKCIIGFSSLNAHVHLVVLTQICSCDYFKKKSNHTLKCIISNCLQGLNILLCQPTLTLYLIEFLPFLPLELSLRICLVEKVLNGFLHIFIV
jgi:hypothetical protein